MKNIGMSILGIFAGVIAIIVIDIANQGLALFIFAQEFSWEALEEIKLDTNSLLLGTIMGVITMTTAGYVAVKIARVSAHINTAIIALIGLALTLTSAQDYPFWFNFAAYISVIPATILGGHLAQRTDGEVLAA